VALVRVYCGLAAADPAVADPGSEKWLTVAVVDDAGRLVDICDVSDDAPGYAELGSLLAQRTGGAASVAVAADRTDHVVTRLLVAAGRYLAYADDDSAADYAERFADDDSAAEIRSSPQVRRAIGLARALQAGVLSAVPQSTPRDMTGLKPVLSAHAAVITGRQAAAATLREVLRELYPAALRAFPDPAEPVPLAIVNAMPEPGALGSGAASRNREATMVGELAKTGVADPTTIAEAVTSLRVAIAETPRRAGLNRSVTKAVAEAVRQAVAAVRACDGAGDALVAVLTTRVTMMVAPPPAERSTVGQPPLAPAFSERGEPEAAPVAVPASPAASLASAITAIPTRRPARQSAAPMAPAAAAAAAYRSDEPEDLHRYARSTALYGTPAAVGRLSPDIPAPGSRQNWPLTGENKIVEVRPTPGSGGYGDSSGTGRVTPPWQAADLADGPPPLRLVEPAATLGSSFSDDRGYDPLRGDPPALRLVEPQNGDRPRRNARSRGAAPERPAAPAQPRANDGDGDLLIFSATRSAWFTDHEDSERQQDVRALAWSTPNDAGWQAAERAAQPSSGTETGSGLPQRVPQQNLVPGSPINGPEHRPLRIVRDPAALAANTTGYFRGWQRGQEVGGYRVGGRPGRESPGGWEFSRESEPEREYEYEYRSARRR